MSKETKQTNLEAAEEGLATSYNAEESALSDEQEFAKWKGVIHGEKEADNAMRQALVHHNSAHLSAEQARAYALIAIAEQLRVANLIALGEAHRTVHVKRTQLDESLGHVEEVDVPKRVLLPDIAAILGLGDDHE